MYSIGAISTACGVKPHTLRAWEQRYGVFNPVRTESGQRMYSKEDMLKAKVLAELTKAGHTISKLAELELDQLNELRGDGNESKLPRHQKEMLSHLEHYNIEGVVKQMHLLKSYYNTRDFIFEVALPLLKKIGEWVQKGRYSVSQEHIMSNLIREELSRIRPPQVEMGSSKILIATPDGNMHELAILIADILCRFHQFQTHYLGASHPADSLAKAVNALNCSHVLLGVISSDKWDFDRDIEGFLGEIDENLNVSAFLVLGGTQRKKYPKFKNIVDVVALNDFESLEDYLKGLV